MVLEQLGDVNLQRKLDESGVRIKVHQSNRGKNLRVNVEFPKNTQGIDCIECGGCAEPAFKTETRFFMGRAISLNFRNVKVAGVPDSCPYSKGSFNLPDNCLLFSPYDVEQQGLIAKTVNFVTEQFRRNGISIIPPTLTRVRSALRGR